MVFVFTVLAIGLACAAFKASGMTRAILIGCCLLNLAGVGKAVFTHDPYAFKLKPNDGIIEPALRR